MQLFSNIEPRVWLTGLFIFLMAYGISTVLIVNKNKQTMRPNQFVSLYMLLKLVRLIVFVAALIVYAVAVKIELKRFMLFAIAMYCVYTVIITIFITMTEKRLKRQ
ncbi:MAG: hypothetical protein LBR66_03655 [Candidatus Symbiothrix sp.]|jgi:hypothetical protein|nr:hypothetical protein [Candidatus Symbiothrix sp.]